MRFLYFAAQVRPEEITILAPHAGWMKPGTIRLAPQLRHSASILAIWRDLQAALPGRAYLYMVAFTTAEAPFADYEGPACYADADHPGLAWILVPKAGASIFGGTAEGSGYESALLPFIERGRGPFIPIDAVIGYMPHVVRRASVLMSFRTRRIPGVVRHETGYSDKGNVMELWGQVHRNGLYNEDMLAASLGCWHVFTSPASQTHYLNAFIRPYLKPSAVMEVMGRSSAVANPIDVDRIIGMVGEAGARGRVVGSFLRPTAAKGVPELLEFYSALKIAGRVDDVIVTWNYPQPCEIEIFESHPLCGRDEWIRHAGRCAAAVFNSHAEGSPVCMIEAMAAGCIPIIPNREWAQQLPFFASWPWKYDSLDEVEAMLVRLWPVQAQWAAKSQQIARAGFDSRTLGSRLLDAFEAPARACNPFEMKSNDELAAWSDGSKIADSLRAAFATKSKWDEIWRAFQLPRDRLGQPSVACLADVPALARRLAGVVDTNLTFFPEYRHP